MVWELRNASLHGKYVEAQVVAEAKEVKRRLVAFYDLWGHIELSAQALLFCKYIHDHPIETNMDYYRN